VPALSDANGALVSRLSISSRFAVVAGQPEVTGRAGNRARMPARASGAGEPGASCSWTRIMTPRPEQDVQHFWPVAGCRGRTRPPGRLPGLLGVMGQDPADHFLLARSEVNLGRRELGMPENELHVGYL
jgi:hypothetical protein